MAAGDPGAEGDAHKLSHPVGRHNVMTDSGVKRRVGVSGEALAAGFLERRGIRIVNRNVVVEAGEIDLVGVDGRRLVAFEVRTRRNDDPLESFDSTKLDRVRRSARRHEPPIHRIDLVTVRLGDRTVDIRWMPDL